MKFDICFNLLLIKPHDIKRAVWMLFGIEEGDPRPERSRTVVTLEQLGLSRKTTSERRKQLGILNEGKSTAMMKQLVRQGKAGVSPNFKP